LKQNARGVDPMNDLFGTDGIRGRAFEPPLDEDTVRRLGAALADILNGAGEPHILLAGDTRASTGVLAEWLAGSFQAGGGRVTWAGVLPTPAVSHLLRTGAYGAGVVISASHNPAQDNGIKVLGPTGEKLADESEARIEARIASSRPLSAGRDLPNADDTLSGRYVDLLVATHDRPQPLSGLHIVVDAANGAASDVAGELLTRLGATATVISARPDGTNINRDCGATSTERLVATVVAEGADGGIALDGDADRAILVDHAGHILDGDDILLVWARHLAATGRLPGNAMVATVMSNYGLEQQLRSEGIQTLRCSVGDRWVWQTMRQHGAALGGEQSGHIICSHYSVTGDGLLTGTQLFAIAIATGRPIAELSNLVRLPQVLLNLPVNRKEPFDSLPTVSRQLTVTEKLLAERGRVLLRYSGTESLARVMVEGEDRQEIENLARELVKAIRHDLG
jgi:phosphoglucosamine mutase